MTDDQTQARADAIGRVWEALDICNEAGVPAIDVLTDAVLNYGDKIKIETGDIDA